MPNRHTSSHKGYLITTRCNATVNNRFEASFTVFPPLSPDACYQRFSHLSFGSREAAEADALGMAHALVEQDCLMR
jgi:hypothetical protein